MTNPTLVTTPFAENGDKNTIPQSVGAEPQNATQDEGFPEVTQTPISAGGIPPERKDFNGILNLYGQHIVHLNKGLPYEFDAAFATAIGGYPLHARIMLNNGDIVRNTVANNSNNPNSDMTGWYLFDDKQAVLSMDEVPSSGYEGQKIYVLGRGILVYKNSNWVSDQLTISNIRATEPSQDQKLDTNNPDLGMWYYDSSDTTTPDNGWFCVVTSSGKRWKRDGTQGKVDLSWGFNQNDEIGVKWQQAIDYVSSLALKRNLLSNTIPIYLPTGFAKQSTEVRSPNFVCTICDGVLTIDCSAIPSGSNAFWVKGIASTLSTQNATTKPLTATGRINFRGAGRDSGQTCIKIGNTSSESTLSAIKFTACESSFENINIWGFNVGIFGTNYDFYLCSFSNFHIGIGYYGIVVGSTGNTPLSQNNSGERCTLRNSTIYGMRYAYLSNLNGMFFDFTDVSFDYIRYNIIDLSNSIYQVVRCTNIHIEAYDGYVVKGGGNSSFVTLTNTDILTTTEGGSENAANISNSICRPFYSLNAGTTVITNMSGQENPTVAAHNEKIWLNENNGTLILSNSVSQGSANRPASPNVMLCPYNFNSDAVDTTLANITSIPYDNLQGNINAANTKIISIGTDNALQIASSGSGPYIRMVTQKIKVNQLTNYNAACVLQPLLSALGIQYTMTFNFFDEARVLIGTSQYVGNYSTQRSDTRAVGYVTPGVVSDPRRIPSFIASRSTPLKTNTMTVQLLISGFTNTINLTNLYVWESK